MAGPQPTSPERRGAPSKQIRRFTIEQANKTLPLVKRVVADIVQVHGKASEIQTKIDATPNGTTARSVLQEQLELTIDRLDGLLSELHDIGCELKDYQAGLVDFIGRHKGHDVCLCWKLGEEKIEFFHEIPAGFAGRQPVAQLEET